MKEQILESCTAQNRYSHPQILYSVQSVEPISNGNWFHLFLFFSFPDHGLVSKEPPFTLIPLSLSSILYVTDLSGNSMHVLLAGDNGMLYVWGVLKRGAADGGNCLAVTCVGVVELPVEVSQGEMDNG